ncbi:hypothetical protein SDC9_145024 [bioreactor metagenome]|uniref:Uncharacterized protein n=1 Tax=bioreactor metagenome TaxID=1076179 RepID=A0A645E7H2_9ZZZZ
METFDNDLTIKAIELPSAAIPMPPPISIMEPEMAGVCGFGAAAGAGAAVAAVAAVVKLVPICFCASVLLAVKKRSA